MFCQKLVLCISFLLIFLTVPPVAHALDAFNPSPNAVKQHQDMLYQQLLEETDTDRKVTLIQQLGSLADPRMFDQVLARLENSSNPEDIKGWIQAAVGYRDPRIVSAMLAKVSASRQGINSDEISHIVYDGLLVYGKAAAGVLCWHLTDPDLTTRRLVSRLLEKLGTVKQLKYMLDAYEQNPDLKHPIRALGLPALPSLLQYYNHAKREDAHLVALRFFRVLSNEMGMDKVLRRLLLLPESKEAILKLGPSGYDQLKRLLSDKNQKIRQRSCRMLGYYHNLEIIDLLLPLPPDMFRASAEAIALLGGMAIPELIGKYPKLPDHQQQLIFAALFLSGDARARNLIIRELRRRKIKIMRNIIAAAGKTGYKRISIKLMEIMALWPEPVKWLCYDSLLLIGREALKPPLLISYEAAVNEQLCLSLLAEDTVVAQDDDPRSKEVVDTGQISLEYLQELLADDKEEIQPTNQEETRSEKLLRNAINILEPLQLYKDGLIIFSRLRKLSSLSFDEYLRLAKMYQLTGDRQEMENNIEIILQQNPDHQPTQVFLERIGYRFINGRLSR